MIKSSKKFWLQRLFLDKGFVPTAKTIFIFVSLTLLVVIGSYFKNGWIILILINSIFFLGSLFDLFGLPNRKELHCLRIINDKAERGQSFSIGIKIVNQSNTSIYFRLIDDLPSSFNRTFPITGEIPARSAKELFYETKASIRGDYRISKIYFRYRSKLGLWEKQITFQTNNDIKIIPDLSKVKEYLAASQRYLVHQGERAKKNRIGVGEFNQIRNYVIGDDPRKINWRQTAKLSELMTNVYEPEHGKQIIILIDSGRIMGVNLTIENRLENAVEAALTVAAAALKQGDYVSVVVFSGGIDIYIPAGKGLSHLHTIIQSIYNIQSKPFNSNYAKVFDYLGKVQKKRSLVLLFSDLEPFLVEEKLLFNIERINWRHHFILIGIEDPSIIKLVNLAPKDYKQAMIKSTAQRQVLDKNKEIRRWRSRGIEILEVPEKDLAIEAVSRYIEVINQEVL